VKAPYVCHAFAYSNGHVCTEWTMFAMSDRWRRTSTASCYAHCYATDYSYFVIERRMWMSSTSTLDTNTSGVAGEYPFPPIF
jgi:hypothetical protein